MIEFKMDAFESLDTMLNFLGDYGGPRRRGYTVEVTPVKGEPFKAVVSGSAPREWWDENDYVGDVVEGELVSWPVEVYRASDLGEPVGEPFVVDARKVSVL